jgi:hypothetical protein
VEPMYRVVGLSERLSGRETSFFFFLQGIVCGGAWSILLYTHISFAIKQSKQKKVLHPSRIQA